MKLSILALTACLSLAACTSTPDAEEAPPSSPEKTAAATNERVQPEIRYYEIADT